jgi:hypothetical protein
MPKLTFAKSRADALTWSKGLNAYLSTFNSPLSTLNVVKNSANLLAKLHGRLMLCQRVHQGIARASG